MSLLALSLTLAFASGSTEDDFNIDYYFGTDYYPNIGLYWSGHEGDCIASPQYGVIYSARDPLAGLKVMELLRTHVQKRALL